MTISSANESEHVLLDNEDKSRSLGVNSRGNMGEADGNKEISNIASSGVQSNLSIRAPTLFGLPIKYFVLVLLVFQNAGAVLLMRYTRSLPAEKEFSTQTAVIMQEVVKFVACVCILLFKEGTLASAIDRPTEALQTSVPAVLYLIQNNLQYLAVGLLDAATYTVSYQTKTLWSGIMTKFVIGKSLGGNKWMGLFLLFLGVVVVQISNLQGHGDGLQGGTTQRVSGLAIIITAAAVSSSAGVYFEKILKGVNISLWTRNLHLAAFSIGTALIPLFFGDTLFDITTNGFFYGYTMMTWASILMNAGGGLLVGAVIKYADAVTKDVAIGASIVISSVTSIHLFEFEMSFLFAIGVSIVALAVLVYGEHVKLISPKLIESL